MKSKKVFGLRPRPPSSGLGLPIPPASGLAQLCYPILCPSHLGYPLVGQAEESCDPPFLPLLLLSFSPTPQHLRLRFQRKKTSQKNLPQRQRPLTPLFE